MLIEQNEQEIISAFEVLYDTHAPKDKNKSYEDLGATHYGERVRGLKVREMFRYFPKEIAISNYYKEESI